MSIKKILVASFASILAVTSVTAVAFAEAAPEDTVGVTEAPAEENAAPEADKDNVETGVEGVAAVFGVAAIAAGAVVVSKKRK